MQVVGGILVAQMTLSMPDGNVSRLERVDVGEASAPIDLDCLELDDARFFALTDDHVVVNGLVATQFRDRDTLELLGSVHSGLGAMPEVGPSCAPLVLGDRLLLSRGYGLAELDHSLPLPVGPIATLPGDYDPAGCGAFGISIVDEHVGPGEIIRHWTVYDQRDPLTPVELLHRQRTILSGDPPYSFGIAVQDEQRAVILEYDAGAVDPHAWSVIDTEGSLAQVSNVAGTPTLDGSVLYLSRGTSFSDASLLAYDLADGTVNQLWELPCMVSGKAWIVGDLALVPFEVGVSVLDVAGPEAPVDLGFASANVSGVAHVFWHDNRVVMVSRSAVRTYEIDLDDSSLLIQRGFLALSGGQALSATARSGDLLLVATAEENDDWQIVSLADADAPVALGDPVEGLVTGAVWSTPHLYLGTPHGVMQYDVSDPAAPVWIASSSWLDTDHPLCTRGVNLLSDGHLLPLDCMDQVSIEDSTTQPGDDLPAAFGVVLHQVSPNPFNPRAVVRFDLDRGSHVVVTVHDVRGRLVKTLAREALDAGQHVYTWQGRDDAGREMPSGTYLVRLATDQAVRHTKAVLVR